MAVSPQAFPPRKRRPSAGSFFSPHFSDLKLLQCLLLLSQEVGSLKPLQFLLKRNASSVIRKSKLLTIFFDELLRNQISSFSASAILCFEEMYIVLQRAKTLIEDCSNGSKMWLLMQNESVANSFHELTVDLSTLLDIFPLKDVHLNDDVAELVLMIRKQSSGTKAYVDPQDQALRFKVIKLLDQIEREIVPDHSVLAQIFDRLGLCDSASCRDEMESLEDEVLNQTDEKSRAELVALIGLVRYAKCVLFGASTPRADSRRRKQVADTNIPVDFRCPITLDLMRDPVVVATGQTFDRPSISSWINAGHKTCPKTGQTMAHTDLIPNRALKNLIALWCREQRIPFETTDVNDRPNGVTMNKTALEATKMTASFLIKELTTSQSAETANRVVHELRVLAKTDSDSRACIAEAGAIPHLVRYLASDNPSLQVNAVTTILNLSILEANKTRIMEADGALNGVVEVLRSGATWEAKANAAATIFSLSGVHIYKKRLGRKTRVIRGLIDLAKVGPKLSKRDALMAILILAGDREAVGRLIEEGVVEMTSQVMRELPEEAVTILELVTRRGGLAAIAAAYHAIRKLAMVLREGSERSRESAAATLVYICRKGGSETVAELAAVPGIERLLWELMGTGSSRAKRKAATLSKLLRRWAAGLDEGLMSGYTTMAASRIVLSN
ncbi:U-box domain-containing protein 16 [Malania oleifera]|uniref:U-box domain-containing protein 16 n=1 Tax=Malania oleifera TaxID=397392 RepID=UPI0025ADBE5A|nr:U-box domain-containing protein 16 [Malania oleifera]